MKVDSRELCISNPVRRTHTRSTWVKWPWLVCALLIMDHFVLVFFVVALLLIWVHSWKGFLWVLLTTACLYVSIIYTAYSWKVASESSPSPAVCWNELYCSSLKSISFILKKMITPVQFTKTLLSLHLVRTSSIGCSRVVKSFNNMLSRRRVIALTKRGYSVEVFWSGKRSS